MPNSKVVVFDVGSTLIHPDYVLLSRWVTSMTGMDTDLSRVEHAFQLAVGGNIYHRISDIKLDQGKIFFNACGLKSQISDVQVQKLWGNLIDSGGANSWWYSVLDIDALKILSELKLLGIRLIAASNSDGTLAEELDAFGLTHFFDEIYDSSVLGVEKPSLSFYELVLRSSKDLVSIHVGDGLVNDCLAAAVAGFHRVLLYDKLNLFPGLPAYVKITSLLEILNVIGNES
jgi:FMN phosphatase YigB (HAD superfamily)